MDLIFNELSIQPLANDKTEGFHRVLYFFDTFKLASEKGFNKIRFEIPYEFGDILSGVSITSDLTLADYRKIYLQDNRNRRYGQLLLGLPRRPYLDDNSEEADQYIQNTFSLKKDNGIVNPFGLASAYLLSTAAIGFCSEPFWENCQFDLIVKGDIESTETVFCISLSNHFENQNFIEFIENKKPIILVETHLNPDEKKIELRDDHGKDKLEKFAKQLRYSPFVVAIINSLPFNPHSSKFIHKIHLNGIIEIVLTKTDKGLGLVVKTTGTNIRETQEIAKILDNKYNQ